MKISLKEFKAVLIVNILCAPLIYLTKDHSLFPIMLQVVLLVLGGTGFYYLVKTTNVRIALLAYIILGVYGLLIETLSIKTGFPYSRFVYSDMMGYKIAEIVPYSIFLIWPTLVISAYSLSEFITKSRIYKIVTTVILLLLLDFVFDPVATALGFWKWEESGIYYGVPFMNFLGWVLSAIVSSIVVNLLISKRTLENKYLILIYIGNLLLWTFLGIKFSFYIPVIISILIFIVLFKKYNLDK
jgi:putative membrane protein